MIALVQLSCLLFAVVAPVAGTLAEELMELPPTLRTLAAPPSQCPIGLPGVALHVQLGVSELLSRSTHRKDLQHELARIALQQEPASVGEQRYADSGDYFLLAPNGTSDLSITELDTETGLVVRVEVLLCSAHEVARGPAATYQKAVALQRSLQAGSLLWAAWATDLGELWRAEALCGGDTTEECHSNPAALGEYFQMMGNLTEEKELIASHATAHSRASIWRFGTERRLILDGVVMSDTRDEHIYHEMLVHPALSAAEDPREVLIIGGGEGATLREVLKDKLVQHAQMVEIDQGLVGLCEANLPAMHQGSFQSPRAKVHFDDGASFLKSAADGSFDVVIVDGIDFQEEESYGDVLFSNALYHDVFRVLRDGGVMAQYMSHVERAPAMKAAGFNDTASFTVDVPTFLGMGARFTVARKGGSEDSLRDVIQERINEMAPTLVGQRWSYLTSETMAAGFQHNGRRLKSFYAGSPGYGQWGASNRVGPMAFGMGTGALVAYATFVTVHDRRRRGYWIDNPADGCSYNKAPPPVPDPTLPADGTVPGDGIVPDSPPLPGSQAQSFAERMCQNTIRNIDLCFQCDQCPTEACVMSIAGCADFLRHLYAGCMQQTDVGSDIFSLLFNLLLFCGVCLCCLSGFNTQPKVGTPGPEQLNAGQHRMGMQVLNGRNLGTMQLGGPYQESSGETGNAQYNLTVDPNGFFAGQCNDNDGLNQVMEGRVNWPYGQDRGEIAWLETRGPVLSEFFGTISGDPYNMVFIQASYISNYNNMTQGTIQLSGRNVDGGASGFFGQNMPLLQR